MKVLLIEDHPIVRAGCARVLGQRADLEVVEAETAASGLRLARQTAPDLVILDLNLPDGRGLDLLREIKQAQPEAQVIIFSMYEEIAFVTAAMDAGARGYISKNDDPDCLLEGVEHAERGEVYLGPVVAQRLAMSRLKGEGDPLAPLSPRERELLRLLAAGQSLAEVADGLKISYRSTAELAARLRSRLGLRSNAALIRFAVEQTAR